MMLDFANSFDTSASLAALYLWLMFSYLSVMLNCDLQRIITNSPGVRHLLGLIAFYFLFTVIDPQNNVPVWVTLTKTVLVYGLFVLVTKSRWYFAAVALLLLLSDQIIRNHIAYLEKNGTAEAKDRIPIYKRVRWWLLVALIAVVFAGTVDYLFKQMREKGDEFRISTFILGTNRCQD